MSRTLVLIANPMRTSWSIGMSTVKKSAMGSRRMWMASLRRTGHRPVKGPWRRGAAGGGAVGGGGGVAVTCSVVVLMTIGHSFNELVSVTKTSSSDGMIG